MSAHDVDGLNSGYARLLLEDYLENPDSVPAEWRALFESGDSELVASHPGLLRLLETLDRGNGHPAAPAPAATGTGRRAASRAPLPPESEAPAPAPAIDETLLGGVAAAMALVKAHRMHGHLAARLDPLGSEPLGDPALDETRLIPPLTPELQERIPAQLLRVHVPGETLKEALPALREVYTGTIAYEIEHLSDHAERVWLRQAIESSRYRQPLATEERIRLLEGARSRGGLRALPSPLFPRPEAVLARGPRHDGADARRGDRDRGRRGRPRDRDRNGPPRAPQRARAHGWPALRIGAARVRGRTNDRRSRHERRGRHRRRQVPPRRDRRARHRVGRGRRSRSHRTPATSKRSIRSSRAGRAPSRPTARAAGGSTILPSRCRS